MTAPNFADRLRAIAESLESALGLKADDPDLLTLKRILLEKAVDLESEAASEKAEDTSSQDAGLATRF